MAAKKKKRKSHYKPGEKRQSPTGNTLSRPGMHAPIKEHPNRIRELRLKGIPLSQSNLGLLVGADSSTVSRDETGDQPISKDRVIAYATLFGVSTFEIFLTPIEEDSPKVSAEP